MQRALLSLLPLVAALACETPLGPGPDRGDPAQYAFSTDVTFGCGAWHPGAPNQPLGLFDIHFTHSPSLSTQPPSRADLERVVQAGGTIVRAFQVNGVRAILPVAAVSRLTAAAITGVRDAAVVEHSVGVGFTTPGHDSRILAHGGRILWASSFDPPDYAAVVPDSGIAGLRREAALRFLELVNPGCSD